MLTSLIQIVYLVASLKDTILDFGDDTGSSIFYLVMTEVMIIAAVRANIVESYVIFASNLTCFRSRSTRQ